MNYHIIRSATFEGMADRKGLPTTAYLEYYSRLSRHIKTMITGFIYISRLGRAMHPGQAGLENQTQANAFRCVTRAVHQNGGKIVAQLAHVGRQTNHPAAVGVSDKASPYFGVKPKVLTTVETQGIVEEFAYSASLAKEAGFDGIQLHCAHGYLIHQFLRRDLNNRSDRYGKPFQFLEEVITAIRKRCGNEFPIWVKISSNIDGKKLWKPDFEALVGFLDQMQVHRIEVSYGTMDLPLNIIRGEVPLSTVLRQNPIYRKKGLLWRLWGLPYVRMQIKPYTPNYNLEAAKLARSLTDIPVYCVGGIRSGRQMREMMFEHISLCRPLICEPDFLTKLEKDPDYQSQCTNCNICTIMVDSGQPLRCYGGKPQ